LRISACFPFGRGQWCEAAHDRFVRTPEAEVRRAAPSHIFTSRRIQPTGRTPHIPGQRGRKGWLIFFATFGRNVAKMNSYSDVGPVPGSGPLVGGRAKDRVSRRDVRVRGQKWILTTGGRWI